MSLRTYPLNDIEYSAEDAELFHCTRKSGIYDTDKDFPLTINEGGTSVTIGQGIGWIRNKQFAGKVVALKEPVTIDILEPAELEEREDFIALRFDAVQNKTEVVIEKGMCCDYIEPERTESVYELFLYGITMGEQTTSITMDNVRDVRQDPNFCGVMVDGSAIDKTLTKEGLAADAKEVGDKFNQYFPSGVDYPVKEWDVPITEVDPDPEYPAHDIPTSWHVVKMHSGRGFAFCMANMRIYGARPDEGHAYAITYSHAFSTPDIFKGPSKEEPNRVKPVGILHYSDGFFGNPQMGKEAFITLRYSPKGRDGHDMRIKIMCKGPFGMNVNALFAIVGDLKDDV